MQPYTDILSSSPQNHRQSVKPQVEVKSNYRPAAAAKAAYSST